MSFGPQLLTESQARLLIPKDALVVRAAHHWGASVFAYGFMALALAFLTLPLWRPYWASAPDIPTLFCYFFGGFAVLIGNAMIAQVTAARQPSNWQLAITRDRLWVKFRSYHHWRAPPDDKVVLQLDRYDVDRLVPREGQVMTGTGKTRQIEQIGRLDILLREKLTAEQSEAIASENTRMFGHGFVKGRTHHSPVLVGKDGALLVNMHKVAPSLRAFLTAVPSTYLIEPVQPLLSMSEGAGSAYPGVDDAKAAEIAALAQSGQTLDAIRLLRERTGLGLKECKEAIEAGRWKGTL